MTRASGMCPARRVAVGLLRTLALMLSLAACGTGSGGPENSSVEDGSMTTGIENVLAAHTAELMRMDGVTGTGLGQCDGTPCIRVYVRDEGAAGTVPKTLDGYTVSTVVTGVIRPRTVE